jgi:hypothetical protein
MDQMNIFNIMILFVALINVNLVLWQKEVWRKFIVLKNFVIILLIVIYLLKKPMKLMKQIVNIGHIHVIHIIPDVIEYGIVQMDVLKLTV